MMDGVAITDGARLLAAFDAAFDVKIDLVTWQRDCAIAPATLDAWATARGLAMTPRPVSPPAIGHDLAHDVTTPNGSRVTVYVLEVEL